MVLPYSKALHTYDTTDFNEEITEGVIEEQDIEALLGLFKEVPKTKLLGEYSRWDTIALLVIMLSLVCLPFAAYFCVGQTFSGGRAAFLLLSVITFVGFSAFMGVSCFLRRRSSNVRQPKLREALSKMQEEVFNKKATIVTVSPFESYITLEMCWKYARVKADASKIKQEEDDDGKAVMHEDNESDFVKVVKHLAKEKVSPAEKAKAAFHREDQVVKDSEHEKLNSKADSKSPNNVNNVNESELANMRTPSANIRQNSQAVGSETLRVPEELTSVYNDPAYSVNMVSVSMIEESSRPLNKRVPYGAPPPVLERFHKQP